MIIRKEQMEVLSAASLKNFQARLVTHIQGCFPRESKLLGEPLTRLLVELGVATAREHGIEGKRDICGYLDLMMVFGPDFDKDTKFPWARAILDDTNIPIATKVPMLLRIAGRLLERMASTSSH